MIKNLKKRGKSERKMRIYGKSVKVSAWKYEKLEFFDGKVSDIFYFLEGIEK